MTFRGRRFGPSTVTFGLIAGVALWGCDSEDLGSGPTPEPASFDRLQAEIFDASCLGCHSGSSPFAGLSLEAGLSHSGLIDVEPNHSGAREDGLVLVAPGEPERSLLLHKLRWDISSGEPTYGARMPMGMEPLTVGQVEFVRRWITEGAPLEGSVADPGLLLDSTLQEIPGFAPPPLPEQGFQVHLERFPVHPGTEREFFVAQELGNTQEAWVNRVDVSMRPGSHHFILYFYPGGASPPLGEFRELWDPWPNFNPSAMAGMPNRRRLGGAQTEDAQLTFPEGVALRVPANAVMDLNSHYLNYSEEVLFGEVYANLHTLPFDEVDHEAFPLFHVFTSIAIPPHDPDDEDANTVWVETTNYNALRNVVMLTSHTHEKGKRYEVYAIGGPRDGELVYETEDWAHPHVEYFDPPLQVTGLRSEATFRNLTSQEVGWGFSSQDEMMITIGYHYSVD